VNFRTLDLNLLRVFDAVMAERSLTRAANRLAMTQPAVSNSLKRFKESVGQELLTRTAYGVIPTPAAEAIWADVRAALGQLQRALDPDAFDPSRDSANFQVAMADATAAMLMPPVVSEIERERAVVNFRVIPLSTRDPRELLLRGDIHCAVGYFPEAVAAIMAQGPNSQMRHARLYESDYVCVMRRDHPLANSDITLDAFCDAHHLLTSFSGRAHGFVDQALADLGRSRRIVLTVNQFFTAGRVVAQSDLLTVLPMAFVDATGYSQELITKPLPFRMNGSHTEMLWHMRHDQSSAQQWLRRQLIAAARTATRGTAADTVSGPG
jgi:DNA-binding transcriptional LysR family regulator